MGLFDEKATLTAGQDPGDASAEGIAKLLVDSGVFKKAVEEGVISPTRVVPELRSIIADPELTDPSLDVSSLRTTTPTRQELLADVPEFSGLQFDPTQQSYIEDLYALYGGALPTIEPPVVTTPTTDTTPTVGTGGEGQATSDLTTGSAPAGDATEGLTQSGTFAGQPTFTTTPGTTVDSVTGDITNPDGSYGGNIVDEVALTGLPSTPIDTSIAVEDLTQPSNIEDFQITTAPPLENLTGDIPPAPAISPVTTSVNPTTGEVFDAQTGQEIGNLYDEVALTGTEIPEQEKGVIQDILGKAGQTVDNALNELSEIPGAVVDFANKTVDVFGQKFNVGRTATGLALSSVFGSPAAVIFGLSDQLSGALPQSSQAVADVLEQNYGVDDQGRVEGNPANNVFAGLNAVSMFGDVLTAAQKRTDKVVDLDKKKKFQGQIDKVTEQVKNQIPAPQENVGAVSIKDTADVEKDLPPSTIDTFRGPTIAEITNEPKSDEDPVGPPEGPGVTADEGFEDTGPSNVGGPPSGPGESSADAPGPDGPSDASAAAQDAARGGQYEGRDSGNGGSGGGGKVVCTMMNESYGFGSFRNKIWLRHSKNLAPEYQIGYHKIFLPLVKISKTNKIIKKILEHIAVHRTIDIRQESRGKMHILGRVYRKILEPICYWVGKYAKR